MRVYLRSRCLFLSSLLLAAGLGAACGGTQPESTQAPAGPPAMAFEGARVIVGDGSAPIENATIVVRDSQFVQVGPAGQVQVPPVSTWQARR